MDRERGSRVERLAHVTKQDLSNKQESIWHAVVDYRSAALPPVVLENGGLAGPYNAMLYAPEVGLASIELVNEVRQNSTLEREVRELAILLTCAYWEAEYEFQVHSEIAVAMGFSRELVDAIGSDLGRDSREMANEAFGPVRDFVVSLLGTGKVADVVYRPAIRLCGEAGVVEIVNIVGVYTMLCLSMNVFEVPGPVGGVARWSR